MLLYCTSIRDGVYAAQICRKVASAENLVRKLIFGHSLEFYINAAEFVATVPGLKLTWSMANLCPPGSRCHKPSAPQVVGCAPINSSNESHTQGLVTYHAGWERGQITVDTRGEDLGGEILLDSLGEFSWDFFQNTDQKGWCVFRSCPGRPEDAWFITVRDPQLSACRKSCRKYVTLLPNKQGTLKSHYWPQAGNRTKSNIIQLYQKECEVGKSGVFFLRSLV